MRRLTPTDQSGQKITNLGAPAAASDAATMAYADSAAARVRAVTRTVGATSGDFPVSSYAGFSQALQAAIDAVNAAGGGTVLVEAGTFTRSARVVPKSNVTVQGQGKGATRITSNANNDWFFLNTAAVTHFWLKDLTIDLNNQSTASGLRLQESTSSGCIRVAFLNGVSGSWFVYLGVVDAATNPAMNIDAKFIDCEFDTHAGSLEMLLIFNARNTHVVRPRFSNKIGNGPILGLWQKCYGTKIIDAEFRDNAGFCIYYSITCEDTWILNARAENSGQLVRGANVSDHGTFGETQAKRLYIMNPVFMGGSNSEAVNALELGAVDNAWIVNPYVEKASVGILISHGTSASNPYKATNWRIVNPMICNSNPTNDFHGIHSAIKFSGGGGSLYGKIYGGDIYDDQATQTQRYPISFSGAYTWDHIDIFENRLVPDTSNGGTSITKQSSAVLGANVRIYNNTDYSGVNPRQHAHVTSTELDLGSLRITNLGTPTASTDAATKGYVDSAVVTPAQFSFDTVRKRPFLYSDFLSTGTNAIEPFTSTAIASGTIGNPNTPLSGIITPNHPGVVRISSSTSANSGGAIVTGLSPILIGGSEQFEAVFRLEAATGTTARLGFIDTASTSDVADGCYAEVLSGGVLTGRTAASGVRSSTGTIYTLAEGTWYRLRIVVNSTATGVDYYLYDDSGTQLWTNSLSISIPTAAGRETGAGAVSFNSGTTSVVLLHVDFLGVTWSSDRVR